MNATNEVETGPVYGVPLIDTLPLGKGMMLQQMPPRADLVKAKKHHTRLVAGYEVLLAHYTQLKSDLERIQKAHNGH